MKCPTCQENEAIIHPQYGATQCSLCRAKTKKPASYVEFTTDSIRSQRREYAKDIIAPYRDGVLSKEYLREYGTSGIIATKEDIANAQEVWTDTKGRWNRHKSRGGRTQGWKEKNVNKEYQKI